MKTQTKYSTIEGGITAPKGFMAGGLHSGIKKAKKDLAIIYSEIPATVSAVYTTNLVKAPPLLWCQEITNSKSKIKAIVINSGNANACTGEEGFKNAKIMAETLAESLNINSKEVLVTSTGVIGVQLPIDIIKTGIKNLSSQISNTQENAKNAAEAIMTTDTFPKEYVLEFEIQNKAVKIAGMAKGSGMIHPNMATMLSFITTDINISQELLDKAHKETVSDTYNMISVDGDTSTNDMVVIMSNGQAGNDNITEQNEDYLKFKNALYEVNKHLAKQIIKDGEGASKFLEVQIKNAKTKEDARKLAKSIVSSNLVKTAFFGEDANWGRILAAMGYSGANFDQNKVRIEFINTQGNIILMNSGIPLNFDENKALEILKEKEIKIIVTLQDGESNATAWGCDLSYKYVEINSQYRT